MSILTEIGQLTAAILLGAMLFFAAVVAPLVFTGLDAATAGRFIRRMFPWYYLAIFVLASLATLLLLSGAPNNGAIMALVAAGAAVLIPQPRFSVEALTELLQDLAGDRARIENMATAARELARPDATERVVNYCLEAAHG